MARRIPRIVLLEDEPLMLDLLTVSLQATRYVSIAGSFATADRALRDVDATSLDAAVVDVNLGEGLTGIDVAARWLIDNPRLGIVLLTGLPPTAAVLGLPDLGSFGLAYLSKRKATSVRELVDAIDAAVAGEIRIDGTVLPELGRRASPLTAHQERVLKGIAQGYSNRHIAEDLAVSLKSVENATTAALQALGVDASDPRINPRVMAALAYLRYVSLTP